MSLFAVTTNCGWRLLVAEAREDQRWLGDFRRFESFSICRNDFQVGKHRITRHYRLFNFVLASKLPPADAVFVIGAAAIGPEEYW